jgi:ribosome-binding factor A
VSPDLHQARIFVSIMGTDEEQAATMAGLESAKAHLRTELGRQVRMKFTPELTFIHDRGPEEAQQMEELLRKIHEDER